MKVSSYDSVIQFLDEKLLTFGGKAFPKFGQVVILAGGAGSGKGFVKDKLLGIEGHVFDVDRLKELVMHSTKFNSKIKEMYGIDASALNLKKKEDVSKLHDVVSKLKISDRSIKNMFTSIVSADSSRKPNLIFDVTLKDMTKFHNTVRQVEEMGYDKKSISLVWVLNTIDVALAQNKSRDRIVADEILLATHDGASYTMSKIVKMGEDVRAYLDGDIYVAFNNYKTDTSIEKSERGGSYIKDADYIQLKEKGKAPINFKDISNKVIDKIKRYVPNADVWN